MNWPLAWVIIAGTIPGIIVGGVVRIRYLPDPRAFKFFIGWVLLYLGYRLVMDLVWKKSAEKEAEIAQAGLMRAGEAAQHSVEAFGKLPADAVVRVVHLGIRKISYEFYGRAYSFNPLSLLLLSLVVGVIGGIYGIGGGAIIAPFIVTFFGLPIHTIAGATLMGTFASSIAGVIVYLILAHSYAHTGMVIGPDWLLGALFGVGGFFGVYLGARAQKFVPQNIIKGGLAILVTFLALRYIVQYFG